MKLKNHKRKIKYYLNSTIIAMVIVLAISVSLLFSITSAFPIIKQGDSYTIGANNNVKLKTHWDGVNAYWYVNDSTGKTVSYWTFPQVQSYKVTGGGSWQYEVPFSLDSSIVSGNKLTQNYTLASGSKLSLIFEELSDGGIKMTWGIWGAYNRNYRIDFTSNSVPSNKGNLNTVKKIFAFDDGIRYRFDDIPASYTINSSVDANKNFHQYIEVGNAYQVWKWIDPVIEGGASGGATRTCNSLTNASWCNFTSPISNPRSGRVTFTFSLGVAGNTTFGTGRVDNYLANGTGIISFNVSNLTGTSNSTHVFMNGNLNSDFSNLNVTMDNTTKLNFWNLTHNGTILIQNGFAQIFVNKTVNGTAMNIWGGNSNKNTSSNGTLTFASFNDFCAADLSSCGSPWTNNRGSSITVDGQLKLIGVATIVQATAINSPAFMLTGLNSYDVSGNAFLEIGMQDSTTYGLDLSGAPNHIDFYAWGGTTTYQSSKDGTTYSEVDLVYVLPTFTNFIFEQRWSNSQYSLFRNKTYMNTKINNIPTVVLYPTLSGRVGGINYVDFVAVGTVADTSPATFGALNTVSGGVSSGTVYAIPQNHPMSEKITGGSPLNITLTLDVSTPVQNIQLFENGGFSFNVTITINQTEQIINSSESAQNGWYYLNGTYNPNNSVSNVLLTFPINNATFRNSVAKSTISIISNDTNVTTYAYNTTHITVNSTYVVGGANNTYNFTIGYNYAPNVTFLNQTFTDNPMPIVFTATDNESNPLNYSIILDGNQTYGAGSPLNVRALAIGVYNVTLWVNETGASATAQNVSRTAYITKNAGTPVLMSPANGSTQTASIVPLSVSLAWSNEGTSYNVLVASDSGFVNIVLNSEPTTNYSSVSVFNTGTYWWRVRTLNGTTYGNWTGAWNFTVNQSSLGVGDGTVGIQGIVYVTAPTGNQLLSGANVYIWNTTWSGNTLSGANGYYLFSGLTTGIYSVRATKEGYEDSLTETVNTTAGTWVTRNILMKPATSTYIPLDHYVKFIVMSGFFTKYANVDASVYKGTDTVAYTTGTTGTDGSVTFKLTKTQRYRITFVNSSQGINKAINIFPVETTVYVIVDTTVSKWFSGGSNVAEDINVTVITKTINGTAAYINVTYVDAKAQTSNLRFYLNQTNASDPLNQTNLNTTSSGTANNITIAFIVSPYAGLSYLVTATASHTTHGSISRTYGVSFLGFRTDTGINATYLTWFAVAILLFLAAFFGATTATSGAMIVTAVGWVFYGFGWLGDLSYNMSGALVLATVVSIIANFNDREKKEFYQ